MPTVKHVLVLLALAACERAPDYEEVPLPAPPPAPLPAGGPLDAEMTVRATAYEEAPPPSPGPLAPPTIAMVRAATGPLPEPPSIEPREYITWLRALPADERLQVMNYCRENDLLATTTCGGIGPLHIPLPPHAASITWRVVGSGPPPVSPFASTEDWLASLSPRQRAVYRRVCEEQGEGMPHSDLCGANTPLVLSFHGAPVAFATGGSFAFQPGAPTATDWPTATTPWIARDVDGDGAITSGAELFGSDTVLPDGSRAAHGFIALAQHDADRDGVIDRRDPVFATLLIWTDRNSDQRSTPDELSPLSARVMTIALDYTDTDRCDARENCEGQRAAFTWSDSHGVHTGAVVDVYLPRRPM